jgi:hypothetical protein
MGELGGYDSNSIKVMHFVIPQQLSASNVSRSCLNRNDEPAVIGHPEIAF